jgi:hypothetical protein
MINKINIHPEQKWKVIAKDDSFWRTGIYRPEFSGPDEIDVLEKHTCPELFICSAGRAGLLIYDGVSEAIVSLQAGEAVEINVYHNGFLIDQDAYFIVVERSAFTSEYIDRMTKKFIRKIEVG